MEGKSRTNPKEKSKSYCVGALQKISFFFLLSLQVHRVLLFFTLYVLPKVRARQGQCVYLFHRHISWYWPSEHKKGPAKEIKEKKKRMLWLVEGSPSRFSLKPDGKNGGRSRARCVSAQHAHTGWSSEGRGRNRESIRHNKQRKKESRWGPPSLYATHFLWER